MQISSETKELFQYPYIKRLYVARFISNYGNGLSQPALAFGILHLKNGSAAELGWVLATLNISLIVMLPFGGVIADRFSQIKMVGLCDVLGSLGLFVQAGFFATGKVPFVLMLIVNGIFGVFWSIWWPAFVGVMPSLLPEKYLQKGNSINALVSNISMILGAMSSGILLTLFGSAFPLALDAASFFISGLLMLTFSKAKITKMVNQDSTSKENINQPKLSFFAEMKSGWKVFLSFKWIVYVVFGFSAIMMAWAMSESVLGPLVFSKRAHGPLIWSSIILGSETAGFLVGSILAYHIKVKYTMRFLTLITFSLVAYIFSLHWPSWYYLIAIAAFAWGISADLWGSLWTTAMQRTVPREHLSRISSFDGMGTMLFRPLGLTLAAPLTLVFGISGTLNIAAFLVCAMIILILSSREVREMVMPRDD